MLTLLVFARAPVPGACKTRLIPRLGARGAAWLQRRLVEHVLARGRAAASAGQPMRIVLCGAPDCRHYFFRRCRQRYGVELARQASGDLGQRMRVAIGRYVATGPVLLVGSDAFGLQSEDLLAAAQALAGHSYALLGAPDGGYVLIGAARPLPSLAGVQWSSGRERAQTAARLARSGSVSCALVQRADFDTPRDWRRARQRGLLPPLVGGSAGS